MEQEQTFETAIARLEEIVALLESGKCSLDDSLKLFEEGTRHASFCNESLKAAEQRIVQLTLESNGKGGTDESVQ